jgi:hypothetical protein
VTKDRSIPQFATAWKLLFGRKKLAAATHIDLTSLLALVLSLSCAKAAFAQLAVRPAPTSDSIKLGSANFSRMFPLREFMSQPGPITLRNTYDREPLSIPIASRLDVTQARLHLVFTNSIALLPGRSQLQVLMNDAMVAQLGLSPSEPEVVADVSIPPALLKYGYNILAFAAAQHYTNGCEDPGAPELWTQIDTAQSTLTVIGRRIPLHPTLADLSELLGPGIGDTRKFLFLTPSAHVSNQELRWGAILAEAIGLRLHYVAPKIYVAPAKAALTPVSNATTPQLDESGLAGQDTVLFGTRAELAGFLPSTISQEITNAFLGIYSLSSDPTHFLLLVSGKTPDQVTRAATALAVLHPVISNAPIALIDRLSLEPDRFFFPNNLLRPTQTYRFSDLGFTTETVRGSEPARFKLDFTLEPDLYEPESANVELLLNFAYGANLRADSAVSIYLNGEFNQAIRLDNQNGAVLRNYRIYIPLRDFRSGSNTLTFEVVMVPLITSIGSQCQQQQVNNLLFTLFDASKIIMPAADHYTAQPDLSLFASTGFPYNGSSHGADTAIRVIGRDSDTISAAWTLLARIAQIDARALPDADVAFGSTLSERHVILIGALGDLSPGLMAGAPINTSRDSVTLPYLTANAAPSRFHSGTIFETLAAAMQPLIGAVRRLVDGTAAARTTSAWQMVGVVKFGKAGIVEAYESFWAKAHTVTLVTAATPKVLFDAVQELVEPSYWYQLAGTVSIWQPGHNAVYSGTAGTTFHVGNVSLINFARYYLSNYPWHWIGTLIGLVFILAIIVRIWSVRRRHRNFPESTDAEF